MLSNIYIFLLILQVFIGALVSFYKNSIYGIIYLILLFFLSFLLLINWHIEFIGLVILIVYVGAIMVFFLFILMLLNLKGLNLNNVNNFLIFFPLAIFLSIIFYFSTNAYSFIDLSMYIDLFRNINYNNQLEMFGFIIFVYLFNFLVVLGFILLAAMIGPIVLTLKNVDEVKKQKVYIQNLRDKKKSIIKINIK